MAKNTFRPKQLEDFEILDGNGNKVGEIRVKPSGILWSPKGAHKWHGVDINTFAQFMQDSGKIQKK
ncbi:MAG: hypothetical protein HZB79_10480 [Deltaproteobacteria bacterium]|nr:hypothetical protein [Deltaproteobacteria bacterium]